MNAPLTARSNVLGELRPIIRRALTLARLRGDVLDDAEQRTLAALAPHVPKLQAKEPKARASYAFRAATRIAIRTRRKSGADVLDGDRALELADDGPSILDILIQEERARRLHGAYTRLEHDDKVVIALLFEEGMSEREAAAKLGVSRGAIARRLRRVRQALLRAWKGTA